MTFNWPDEQRPPGRGAYVRGARCGVQAFDQTPPCIQGYCCTDMSFTMNLVYQSIIQTINCNVTQLFVYASVPIIQPVDCANIVQVVSDELG